MNKLVLSISIVCLSASVSLAQFTPKIYTRPKVPPRSVLSKLQLKLAWAAKIPTDGLRDGLATIQFMPSDKGDELLVQTRSGRIQLMDATNGDLKWRATAGLPYRRLFPAAFNKKSVFVTRSDVLYVLSRKNGKHKIFSIDASTGGPILGNKLDYPPSAAPIAISVAIYIPSTSNVTGYIVPLIHDDDLMLPSINPASALPANRTRGSKKLIFNWNQRLVGMTTALPPVAGLKQRVCVIGGDGTFVSMNVFKLKIRTQIVYEYKVGGAVSVGMGRLRDTAYIAAEDRVVYALNMISQRLEWRYMADGAISRTPQVTEKDVFITSKRRGLARVDRQTGKEIWKNREADQFLAQNKKFVYATDQRRFLLVMDYLKGKTLARYNIRDFYVPLSNVDTDRIYLAAHDGTIICLHWQGNPEPFRPIPFPKKKE